MKSIALFLMITLICSNTYAQDPYYDADQKKVLIEKKYTELGKSKDVLLDHVQYFASNTFVRGSSAIDYIDEQKGLMILKAKIIEGSYTYTFNVILRWRDNELKYTITDIVLSLSMSGFNTDTHVNSESQIKPNRKPLAKINKSIQDQIEKALNTSISDDW
jgi:hypothetical protein